MSASTRRLLLAAAVGTAGIAAAGALLVHGLTLRPAARPLPHAGIGTPGPVPVVATSGPALPASVPVRLDLPSIGLHTPLGQVGLNPDRTLQTPPLAQAGLAAWYRLGTAPGARGPAVIVGHVDTVDGPAVFYRIGDLRAGDEARVTRADGRTAVFRVDPVERVPKTAFPTARVYAPVPYAALRLITCGGDFDRSTGHYVDNVIAYAHLTGAR